MKHFAFAFICLIGLSAQAQTMFTPDGLAALKKNGAAIPTPVWYDSMTISGNTNSAIDQAATYRNRAVAVTVAVGGTCSKVRIGMNTLNSSAGFKVAVFDGSKNRVAQIVTTTGTTPGLIEFAFTPFAVSAGTYYIGWDANVNSGQVLYWSKSGTTGTEIHEGNTGFSYAAYAPSALGSADAGTTETVAAGMYVQ